MKCIDIEIALAKHFNPRVNIIVPNVSWGLGIHECDMLICTKSGYLTEIEIKTSLQDMRSDLKKRHAHESRRIKNFYFAIPENLVKHKDIIPERAGIIMVREIDEFRNPQVQVVRQTQTNSTSTPLTPEEMQHLCHLGTMRIWSLKRVIAEHINNQKGEKMP